MENGQSLNPRTSPADPAQGQTVRDSAPSPQRGEAGLHVLLVAEGSGGHVIPALQVASELACAGARVKLWYAQRREAAPLTDALLQETMETSIDVEALSMKTPLGRLWGCGRLWWQSHRCFQTFHPDVVVGFGGWVSVPVVLAARQRHIPVLLHEQNVHLGRANRLLARWANRLAVSFEETQDALDGTPSVRTGLPIRRVIGSCSRQQAAGRFGFDAARPTLLILGGSQGAHAINQLLIRALPAVSEEERRTWQVIHLTGAKDKATVERAYASQGIRAAVAPVLTTMDAAYGLADVVIARAGASTIAELAQCAKPAILIPYPLAEGHQRANAHLVEAVGGAIVLDEAEATPEQLLGIVRHLLQDRKRRERMAFHVRTLAVPEAAARLTRVIAELGEARS